MEFEKQKIIEQINFFKACNMSFKDKYEILFDKNTQKSIEVRKKGNELLTKNNHDEELHEKVWKFYTESIAFALTGSEELACGYSNRSAFLLHLKKYKDCLLDIERALKITQLSTLKVKLFCRQTECFTALQDGKQSNSLEKAKYWLNRVDNSNDVKHLNDMINKAETVMKSNRVFCVLPKEKKKDISCDNDTVSIKYDEKYGRHLVATRDILPGEFVYLEKHYATSISSSKLYAYCSHCLGISWTLIPCDQCAYFMFCSDECKNEAWEKYHDIECCVKFKYTPGTYIFHHFAQLALRSLIMGIREAGSIKKLQDLVCELEKCTDIRTKGFSKNGQFCSNSIKSLLSLTYAENPDHINYFPAVIVGLLVNLARNTTIFGKKIVINTGRDLVQHEDLIFVGSVLLRLNLILDINAFGVINQNDEKCKFFKDSIECLLDACCMRGAHISLFTSLINHSCDNNVDRIYTNDGRVAYFALKPIPKDSQIFSCYYSTDYLIVPIGRNYMLNRLFEFSCDCLACQEDWPDYGTIMEEEKLLSNQLKHNSLTIKLMEKSKKLLNCIENDDGPRSRKTIRTYAKKHMEVINAMKTTKVPTAVTTTFRFTLCLLMEKRYYQILKVPDTC